MIKQLLRSRALLRIFRETLAYEIFKLGREPLLDRRWLIAYDISEYSWLILIHIGRLAVCYFDGKYAQAPNIHFVIIPLFILYELWGHPVDGPCLRYGSSFGLGQLGRRTEVCELYISFFVDQDVIAFYISVDHAFRVQIVKALQHPSQYVGTYFLVDFPTVFT